MRGACVAFSLGTPMTDRPLHALTTDLPLHALTTDLPLNARSRSSCSHTRSVSSSLIHLLFLPRATLCMVHVF
ncbi:hypothetical protein VNO80_02700 [Phaseolus coccineus]|uniref:Uncharacterized protein n=1 Tax=Phaseolus coccineus TaxID=3886 RepID=A0AAN9NUQ3_PHACN